MAPSAEVLRTLAASFLDRQEWFHLSQHDGASGPPELLACDVLREEPPGLARLICRCSGRRYQLLFGWRPATAAGGVLAGRESSLVGSVEDAGTHLLVYDALADDELLIELLELVTEGRERVERVRRLETLVSHAALVFDERLFMKCYRVLEDGPRPEAEMMFRLDEIGFNALLTPVARWQAHGFDLAVVREFLPSALEGRLLALTSLRDLLAHSEEGDDGEIGEERAHLDEEAARAGGDLAAEMRRLGATTAALHVALEGAFDADEAEPSALAALVRGAGGPQLDSAANAIADLEPGSVGQVIRLHGDYHLRRVMRAEAGWLVAGFADDPLYAQRRPGPSLAPRVGSPLEDCADMCFALERVAAEALAQRASTESSRASGLASAWERRNRSAFLGGYLASSGVVRLLPASASIRELMLDAFVAVRRARYEATPWAE